LLGPEPHNASAAGAHAVDPGGVEAAGHFDDEVQGIDLVRPGQLAARKQACERWWQGCAITAVQQQQVLHEGQCVLAPTEN
jgi:hypothetical protein